MVPVSRFTDPVALAAAARFGRALGRSGPTVAVQGRARVSVDGVFAIVHGQAPSRHHSVATVVASHVVDPYFATATGPAAFIARILVEGTALVSRLVGAIAQCHQQQ